MLSDAQKKLAAHAAELLRANAAALTDANDVAESSLVATIIDSHDTADKLDAMATQVRAVRYIDETEMA